MAAVLEPKKDPAAKFGSQVDEQIAQATSRIRGHDLAFGGLVLASIVLVYATVMALLDKSFSLPEWARQVGLFGLLATLAAAAYRLIIRPLRADINPLYAAIQVEKTIEDPKNGVTGYIDAKTNVDLHPTVRAAMSAKAAKIAAKADLNRAVDHRSLVYTAGVGVVFLLALIVLFFLFGLTQFSSVMGRTFVPFSSDPLATRTQLRITKPDPAEATITAGQGIVIGVEVGGRIPSAENPDHLRVLIRHNPSDPTYVEVPLEPGDTTREWQVRVPDYLVQNGFWYKVVGGDTETPEYHVTVRSLPLASITSVEYAYPAYLNRSNRTSKDARIEAVAGTKITLTAKANRTVKDAKLLIDSPGEGAIETIEVPWTKVEGHADEMRFSFRLSKSGFYRVVFTAANGERSADPAPEEIRVSPDEAPRVEVVKPEEDPVTIAANGQLAVDGTIGDDYGIDSATLRMRVVSPTPMPLPAKPFNGGQSLRRESDNTWPTSFEYKDSVDLGRIVDAEKKPIPLTEGMVLEYWLEATDNRQDESDDGTRPAPQVGRSKIRKVVLGPPAMTQSEQQKQEQQKQDRKQKEEQHNQQQQKKLDNEPRKPDQPPMNPPEQNPQDQNPQDMDQGGTEAKKDVPPKTDNPPKKDNPEAKGGNDTGTPMPKEGDPKEPKKNDDANPMPMGGGGKSDVPPKKDDPSMPPPKSEDMNPGTGNPMTAPMPKDAGTQDARNKADQLSRDIDKASEPSEAKPDSKPDGMNEANPEQPKSKPEPMAGMENQPKPEPKPTDPRDPMSGSGAAEQKPEPQPSQDGSAEPKPQPKDGAADPMNPEKQGMPAAEEKPQPQPMDQNGSADKPKPEPKKENPGDPKSDPSQDRSGGGAAKPESKPEDGKEPMPKNGSQPQDGQANNGESKPSPSQQAGIDKDSQKQPEAQPADASNKAEQNAGQPKPQPEEKGSEGSKPMPKDDGMAGGMSEPKPEPKTGNGPNPMDAGNAAETKPNEPKDPMATGNKPEQKGRDKPIPSDANNTAGQEPSPKEKTEPKGSNQAGQKIDPKDVAETAKDLNNPDPMKQQAARDKLDKSVGEQNRKEIEKNAKDLNNPDPDKKAEAEKNIEDIANKAAKEQQQKKDNAASAGKPKLDPKDLEKAVQDANSADPKEQKAAKEQLDKLSPEDRKKAEDIAKGLDSKNPDEQKAAQQKLDDLKEKMEQQAKKDGEPRKEKLTPEEIDDLAKKANDLNSPDDKARKEAEQAFDDKVGKAEREKIQKDMKDQFGDPEAKAEQLKKQLEKVASGGNNIEGNRDKDKPGRGPDPKLEETKADLANRLKSAELQLEKFDKHKEDQAIKDAGWTPELIDKVMNAKRQEIEDLKAQLDDLEKGKEPGAPTTNVSGGGKLEPRTSGTAGGSAGGVALPPPGYADPAKKFNIGAVKVPGNK